MEEKHFTARLMCIVVYVPNKSNLGRVGFKNKVKTYEMLFKSIR